jgi:hypothetical protein
MLHLICRFRIQVHHDNDDEPDTNMATEITNEIQLVREKASKDKHDNHDDAWKTII